MSINKIEGCAWHLLPDETQEANVFSGVDYAAFARLMRQGAPLPAGGGAAAHPARGGKQRYQLVGGHADGLVFEVNEGAMGFHMRVEVPQQALYCALRKLMPRLIAVMREAGYSLSLEVNRANPVA